MNGKKLVKYRRSNRIVLVPVLHTVNSAKNVSDSDLLSKSNATQEYFPVVYSVDNVLSLKKDFEEEEKRTSL